MPPEVDLKHKKFSSIDAAVVITAQLAKAGLGPYWL